MQLIKCRIIKTFNDDKEQTGYIINLADNNGKSIAYMNVLFPKAFKGYHIHTERTNRIYCLGGEVAIYTKEDEVIKVTPLSANSEELAIIPPHTPTGIENLAVGNSVLLFFPDPPFDPANKHEMIPVKREEVENEENIR